MKINGMCPICYLKRLIAVPSKITEIYDGKPYGNGVALTPPMGWSSWNTFANRIDEDLIYDTAVAMKNSGLKDAGYEYVNIDDCWVCNNRDENGDLQPDPLAFKNGIAALTEKVNALGLKLGIYSSNGTATCEDLPASLYHERADARIFAKWGIEYFKYDFCHNEPLPSYAPLIYALTVSNDVYAATFGCTTAELSGNARFMRDKRLPEGKFVSGLDRREGRMKLTVEVPEDGEYFITIHIKKRGGYKKCVMLRANGECRVVNVPSQKHYNTTAKFSTEMPLKKGKNEIELFNPISRRADSAMLQYQNMGRELKLATEREALRTGKPEKPIVFSLCEWGRNQPYKWGATAGNLWRTTFDIKEYWPIIMQIYRHNVKLDKYASAGAYNDPDMLEVGNGKLTLDENVSHFSLWCMMNAPLILGNDLRNMTDEVLKIVTNKNLIAINQDKLCVQAARIRKGPVDILRKPLADGSVAICFFNKGKTATTARLKLGEVKEGMKSATAVNQWTDESVQVDGELSAKINGHGVAVFVVK